MTARNDADPNEAAHYSNDRDSARPGVCVLPNRHTDAPESPGTGYFCPVCGYEFPPEEIGRKPHCRRCGYLES